MTGSDLALAAGRGDFAAVRQLLDSGVPPDSRDARGWTPLLRALEHGHEETARALLEAGADPLARDRQGRTALHWAARQGGAAIAPRLLDAGAGAAEVDLHARTTLLEAAAHGRAVVAGMLLDRGPWKPHSREYHWRQAFDAALERGHIAVLREFLDRSFDVNSRRHGWRHGEEDRVTPLIHAAGVGREPVVAFLLERGANVALPADQHRSALSEALRAGHEGIVRRLREAGAVLDLRAAVASGRPDLVEALLSEAQDREQPDREGRSLLSWASATGLGPIARRLLEAGVDASHPDRWGRTPLLAAARTGDLELVQLLIERGADPLHTSEYEETALSSAAGGGHAEVVRWLLNRCGLGPDGGTQALVSAAVSTSPEGLRLLLDAGADPDGRSRYLQRTPLMEAVLRARIENVRLLLGRGADLHARDPHRQTALKYAAAAGRKRTLIALLEAGPRAEDLGESLWFACQFGHTGSALVLLEAGADPNVALQEGRPPLWWARRHGLQPLAEALLAHGARPEVS